MAARDPRVDAYIAKSAPFARPILTHFRELVLKTAPTLQETVKWSMPHYVGRGIICNMGAFKEHCAFGFWNGDKIIGEKPEVAMGHLGRVASLKDLPTDRVLAGYIREAVKLDAEGIKREAPKPVDRSSLKPSPAFTAALAKNKKAKTNFDAFPPGARNEYLQWHAEAKTDATRDKRIASTIEWVGEGKRRNWKYEKC